MTKPINGINVEPLKNTQFGSSSRKTKLAPREDFSRISNQLARGKVLMLRLGSNLFQMRSVRNDDILLSRLKLMVVMAQAYLQEASLGKTSIRSIVRNAGHISHLLMDWNAHLSKLQINPRTQKNIDIDHIFYQRIKLLAIMVKSIAQGNPLGTRRRAALQNNIDYICEILPHLQPHNPTVLTVVK